MLTVLSSHSVWFMSMLSIILPFSHSFIEPISSTSPPHPNQSEHHPSLNIHLHHQQHLKRRESRPRFCHCWDSIRVQSPNTLINFSISENHVQFFQVISPYWINVTSKAPNKHKTQQMKKKKSTGDSSWQSAHNQPWTESEWKHELESSESNTNYNLT